MKILKYLFYFLILLIVTPLILIQTDFAKNYASEYVKEMILKKMGYRVTFEDVSLFPPFSFGANQVKVSDKNGELIKIDHLHFHLSPLELNEQRILLNKLFIEGLEFLPPKVDKIESSSWEEIPWNLEIESFKIHQLKTTYKGLNTHQDPISIEGSLYLQPSKGHINIHSRCWFESNPKEILRSSFEFMKDHGRFQIDTAGSLSGNFTLKENSILLSDLKAKGGPLLAEGNLHIDHDWNILKSSLSISTLELSEATPLQGTFAGEIELSGKLLKPEIEAKFSSQGIQWRGHLFEDISLHIQSQKRLSLQFIKEGHPYRFVSELDWKTLLSPKFSATIDIADILQLFRIENSNISGLVTCEIDLTDGTTLGNITLKKLAYESYELGCSFQDVNARMTLQAKKLTIHQISGRDAQNGTFSGDGEILLEHEVPFEIRLDLQKTEIFNLDFFKAILSGKATFKGNIEGATLSGNAITDLMHFSLQQKGQAVRKTLDVTYINQPPDETEPTRLLKKKMLWPLELDIKVKTGEEAIVDGKGLSSLWKGKAAITGKTSAFAVNGEMHCKEGTYQFRGKKINLKSGTVSFQGDIEKNTTLYIIGEMDIDKINAEVIVKGSTTNPAISFRSTPPMSQREILSWILFNKGFQEISEFQGTQLNESITDLVQAGDTGPDLLTRLQSSLGLDRIEVSGAKDRSGMSIQVGKYITKKTFLTLSHNSGSGSDTNSTSETHSVGIETILLKNIRLQAEVDDGGNGQANIIWKKDY